MTKYIVSRDSYWDPCESGAREVIGLIPETDLSELIEAILKKGYVLFDYDSEEGYYRFALQIIWDSPENDHGDIYYYVGIRRQPPEIETKTVEQLSEEITVSKKEGSSYVAPGLYEIDANNKTPFF